MSLHQYHRLITFGFLERIVSSMFRSFIHLTVTLVSASYKSQAKIPDQLYLQCRLHCIKIQHCGRAMSDKAGCVAKEFRR
jgi:hypothetical protein